MAMLCGEQRSPNYFTGVAERSSISLQDITSFEIMEMLRMRAASTLSTVVTPSREYSHFLGQQVR